jgi:hypothetical protein
MARLAHPLDDERFAVILVVRFNWLGRLTIAAAHAACVGALQKTVSNRSEHHLPNPRTFLHRWRIDEATVTPRGWKDEEL